MGMDFVALLKYAGPDGRVTRALDRLEAESPEEVRELARAMAESGYRGADGGAARWEYVSRPELIDPALGGRPGLPDLGVALWLPEGFALTFGAGAVEVYHLLRWSIFLGEPPLQRA